MRDQRAPRSSKSNTGNLEQRTAARLADLNSTAPCAMPVNAPRRDQKATWINEAVTAVALLAASAVAGLKRSVGLVAIVALIAAVVAVDFGAFFRAGGELENQGK